MSVAFVTGGAVGIGAAIAEKLKKSGYKVIIGYFSSEKEAKKLEEDGFVAVRIDVTDSDSVSAAFSYIFERFGGVDVLINNAGVALKQKVVSDVTESEFDFVFAVNVKGVFNCSRQAIGQMLGKGRGDIVNVSSVWGCEGASCEAVYSASKGAVNAFTRSLAEELSFSDICVQAIAPSLVMTKMNAHLTENDVREFLSARGSKRALTPEDVADAVIDLLKTRENGAVTVLESVEKRYKS